MKKKNLLLQVLLYPLSVLYGLVIRVHHFLYNVGVLPSTHFRFPTIIVGNLSMGGTGKTPFTSYLCDILSGQYQVAVISRGYMRKTKGFIKVADEHTPNDVGDEPYWTHKKHPKVVVCVGENRVQSVIQSLQVVPFIDVIFFDDAFQHRRLRSSMNILLTSYGDLFSDDLLFPVGNLRDVRQSASRANVIVVTKCPEKLPKQKKENIIKRINPKSSQHIYFSYIHYSHLYHLHSRLSISPAMLRDKTVVLVTGIANPKPLEQWLTSRCNKVVPILFSDHYAFSYEDILNIIVNYDRQDREKCIVITEKDAVKMDRFRTYWKQIEVYVLVIQSRFLSGEDEFKRQLVSYIDSY